MHRRSILALGGAALTVALAPGVALARTAAAPAASRTPTATAAATVSVRIEGAVRTLLPTRSITVPSGSVTRGGAPSGACRGDTVAGALNAATHGHWGGKYFIQYDDYVITSVLGDTPNPMVGYWGVWVDNRFETTGACAIQLRGGDQILFAVDSTLQHEHPLGLSGPATATAGSVFRLKVVSYSDAGRATPLGGAQVTGAGLTLVTNSRGFVSVDTHKTGTLSFDAGATGHIRAATLSVRVS
ncbi:MAG: hypothetical protein ACLP50_25220 [Solirubrobacteraceae bacterium]